MSQYSWDPADRTALREFFKRTPREKLKEILMEACEAKVTVQDVLEKPDSSIARLASMRAGWEGAVDKMLSLADDSANQNIDPGHRDMT